ncbi:dihydropteroate synthase [Microbacterium sp. MEC084]|jgi:dihydropteroate synthase|uniref:dihydropteroate synthase n=1 Tax=unclassified Microbacterium TaxID=2609290 RepID=UPI0006FD461F|nr:MULTISPECIES: dihydropteroate synthase [unclassified Microbacterium]KQZ09895.1 dihydropteroate synthase [Microbacterium sp. Root53]MCD1267798.1 dihydropteroate synthase [Microbacterium sp. MEC084]
MTQVWGIVNVTPDSFSDGGRYLEPERAIAHGRLLRAQGADVLDIGGESTRPGAEPVGAEEEIRRVLPVIEALAADGAVVSVDTYRAETARAAVEAGAAIVNDVAGGLADPEILRVVAASDGLIALGHWRGPSADMYAKAEYADIGREVAAELTERVDAALAAGIPRERIILDPGVGFAKAGDQNWALLRELDAVQQLGFPVLIGTSRKRFLASALGEDARIERKDLATAVTSALAAARGIHAVRVHDVQATRDAIAVVEAWQGGVPSERSEAK